MKLAAVAMVRNEADVIESFVRHHAAFVDELSIADHGSDDGTRALLEALRDEGLPVHLHDEPSPVQRQNLVVAALVRQAAARGADWVVPLDADEFLVATGERGPRAVLSELPSDRPLSVRSRTYVPRPADPAGERCPLRRISHRRPTEPWPWAKTIVPARIARSRRLALLQGNHAVVGADGAEVEGRPAPELALAHFPVRSAGQLARKVLAGWPAHCARPDRIEGEAYQWQRLYRELSAGPLPTRRRLRQLALEYGAREDWEDPDHRLVRDPVEPAFTLRLRPPPAPSPLEALARTAERLAVELGDALRASASVSR